MQQISKKSFFLLRYFLHQKTQLKGVINEFVICKNTIYKNTTKIGEEELSLEKKKGSGGIMQFLSRLTG